MNSDIRIAVSFRGHRKRKRLRLLLGPGSTDYLIDLWLATAMNHPSGLLQGMDETDIALESGWDGEPSAFVAALLECGFLEKAESGAYALHDWQDHQGYVVHADARKEKARKRQAQEREQQERREQEERARQAREQEQQKALEAERQRQEREQQRARELERRPRGMGMGR